MKDQLFFCLSQEFTHLVLGRDFYRSSVHQKYISSKTWPNLASYPSQSSFGNRQSRHLPKAASCWREVKHLWWLLALWLMESGRTGIAAALPSESLWEGVAAGYYSQVKQWSGGHHPILPASWLQEQEFQLACPTPLPYSPSSCLSLQVPKPTCSLWAEG